MKRDPVAIFQPRRFGIPLRDRPSFYLTIIFFCLTLIGYGLLAHSIEHEAKQRTTQLQDVICGVYVPIGNIPITVKSTPQLRTIVAATHHGALRINCPNANAK
jgi:uncharacterized membrane protein